MNMWCFPGRRSHSFLLQLELKKPQSYTVQGNLVPNSDLGFCSWSNSHLFFLGEAKRMFCPSEAVVTVTLAGPEVIWDCVSKVFSDLKNKGDLTWLSVDNWLTGSQNEASPSLSRDFHSELAMEGSESLLLRQRIILAFLKLALVKQRLPSMVIINVRIVLAIMSNDWFLKLWWNTVSKKNHLKANVNA